MHSLCFYDFSMLELYQSCPGDRVLLRTKPKEKLDEVLALKAVLRETWLQYVTRCDFCDSTTHVFSGAWFMIYGFYGSLSKARLTMHKWKKDGSTYLPLSKQLRVLRAKKTQRKWSKKTHTDAPQARLQRLRTIVESKKVLALVETLRLQTLRYIHMHEN